MVLVDKKQVIISKKTWDILKKDKEYKELLEVIEETAELEKAKKDSNYFLNIDDYKKQREKQERIKKTNMRRKRVSGINK
ncbi:MAG TPA: hypothetical protein PK605_14045 [Ignavibacteria bacterium]|nr:hypothetical protein [Bacteroidota bacterium]HRF66802.1 hypothetical protein [Ignavibacteria bacterium]HRJ05519.1 hypothetical protein [Ignavibacteria bacterium]HRJ84965.1 hypothetical protein [Ignavibacteria bacterium]